MKKTFILIVASMVVCVLSAQATLFTVDGQQYNVQAVNTTFNASTALLESQPWFGDESLANDFANAVGSLLGGQLPGSLLASTDGPLFDYDSSVDFALDYIPSSTVYDISEGSADAGDTFTYAEVEAVAPVPESSTFLTGALMLLPFGSRAVGQFRKRTS